MPNPKIETLVDSFTGTAINTTLWNNITAGTATLDTLNNLVTLQQPTVSGTTNTFATTNLYDATGSSLYAQIGTVPNGNGGTKTILKLTLDANNAVSMRIEAGVFKLTLLSGGVTTNTTLPAYDPNAHRWWRIREAAGVFYADAAADGMTWTNLAQTSYSWSATAVSPQFQASASTTEAAGNVAWIAHVNTPVGGRLNPNWPVVEYSWAPFWNCNGGSFPADRYADISDRSRGHSAIQRGRQYELDQIRSGTLDMTIVNTDGSLDPVNTSGPWYGHIMPYQPTRVRAQWPATINLLTEAQATGGDLGGYALGACKPQAGLGIISDCDTNWGQIVSDSTAWQGARSVQFSVPNGTASATFVGYSYTASGKRGATYTMSMRVRNLTASTSLQVRAFIGSKNAAGTATTTTGTSATLTGSATAAWTTITVTATLASDAAYLVCGVQLAAAATATVTLDVDGWQLERGSQASVWNAPGVWYPMYAGFMERFPSSWTLQGTYGLVQSTAVDALSLLSQRVLRDPLTEEIYSRNPRFLFTLADPQNSQTFTDAIGAYPPAPLGVSKFGAGTLTSGNTITSTSPGGTYTGSTGTVVTVSNPNPGTGTFSPATFIQLTSSGITGPTDPQDWTRMIAFRYTGPTPTASFNATMWSSLDSQRGSNTPAGSRIQVLVAPDGKPYLWMSGPNGTVFTYLAGGAVNVVDGNWHLLIFGGLGYTFQQVMCSLDGNTASAYFFSQPSTVYPTGLVGDNLGGFVDTTIGNSTNCNFQGDISYAAEWPFLFASSDITAVYNAWKNSFSGDSSNARYARILGWGGYSGPNSIQTGLTTSMGPAAVGGQDVLSALQAVVDTENGEHYVDRSGAITFKARSARYNSLTPVYTFGENTAAGEIPYEEVRLDYDPTRLANQIKVTQASSSQVFSAQDSTSITNYFPRQLTRTVNSSSTQECQDAANYLLSRYKNPAVRVSGIRIHPSANPSALWPVCLSLELGTRVRVMRRPPSPAASIQVDCFVENIAWELDDQNEAFVTLQCSPVDLTPYGIFAAFHTTLNTTIASGVSSIVINNGQDNTNPLAAQLPVGGQLVLGQNTANQETVTIQAIGATSPGWTTATITLTAATTKSHTAGDTVCEPLPTGTTDPTTWDAVSKFDSVAFAY